MATGLTPGNTYKFKVQSRNSVGYGQLSSEVAILAAQVPDQPSAPFTTTSAESIVITFAAPFNGGAQITAYRVTIRASDDTTYLEDLVNCDASTAEVMTSKRCTIPFDTVRAAPFSLPWGSHIWAKVTAINLMGSSASSVAGNGA